MNSDEDVSSVLEGFCNISVDPIETRMTCVRCGRPESVCWCRFIPSEPLEVQSNVIILQHPSEEKRCLRTAPMLQQGLPPGKCFTYKGRRFNRARNKELVEKFLLDEDTVILYPGEEATPLSNLATVRERDRGYNVVILDGTWVQAKSIYYQSELLHQLQQVRLDMTQVSQYVIRTQPTNSCVSTVEAVAVALSVLEEQPEIVERLLRPLRALCDFQLEHGAVEHQSSEFHIKKGTQKDKPVPKRTRKKLRRSGLVLS